MAYVVESQQDLLDALNTFLHESIVLPPGEWDKKTLLPIMDRTRQKVLKKRTKRDEHKAAGEASVICQTHKGKKSVLVVYCLCYHYYYLGLFMV